jgi:tripartite ATP-independent transporter DctM subunit
VDWWAILLVLFGGVLTLLLAGLPVAFSFMLINFIGLVLVFGFGGLALVGPAAGTSIVSFSLTPLPMFILMGEVLTRSGLASDVFRAADHWIGRLPGRLAIVTVTGGAFFGAMSGSGLAATSVLGRTMIPEMESRHYKPAMSVAPVLGAAGLDPLIPPSILAVLVAVQAGVSVGALLLMATVAGVFMAVLLNAYFFGRAVLQPDLAPPYVPGHVSLRDRLLGLRYILLVGALVFVVLGLIMTGTATPSESAALGAAAALLAVVAHGRFSFQFLRNVLRSSAATTGSILIIFVGSIAYSQLLAATGASAGLVEWVVSLPLDPSITALAMIGVVLLLGLFIDAISIILIAIPLFMPVVRELGLDALWFNLLLLIGLEVGALTPPMGLQLYVLKGVQPHLQLGDMGRAAVPVVLLFCFGILVFWGFPDLGYVLVPEP